MAYAGLIIFFILLWIRPEYMFLLFYVIANSVLVMLFTVWSLTPQDIPVYVIYLLINNAILIAIGAPIVALRKWLKTRKTGSDKRLDKEMEQIRAEIAARENKPTQS
jgi:membrane protein implicated in regulation of membrane protease activity